MSFEELFGLSVSEWSVSDPAQALALAAGVVLGLVLAVVIQSLWERKGRR